MITTGFSKYFANEWINSWNSHNLEKIISHYSEDFIIETPMATKIFPETGGIVRGKEAVKVYWTIGLERIPNLKFEILDVLIGVNGLSIYYLNTATNKKALEIMSFNNELKVNKATVFYSE